MCAGKLCEAAFAGSKKLLPIHECSKFMTIKCLDGIGPTVSIVHVVLLQVLGRCCGGKKEGTERKEKKKKTKMKKGWRWVKQK